MDVKQYSSSNLNNKNLSKSVPDIQNEIKWLSCKKGKYDHVESKVLQYRRQIQRQTQESKNKKAVNIKVNEFNENVNTDQESKFSNTCTCCMEHSTEKDEQIQALLHQNNKLLEENAEAAVKVDYFRTEVSRLKYIIQGYAREKENSPNPSYKNKSPFRISGFLQTPIRNISSSLLRNSRSSFMYNNTNESALQDESELDFSSDADDSDVENIHSNVKSTSLCSEKNENSHASTPNSERPLLRPPKSGFKKTVKKIISNITCMNANEGAKSGNFLMKFKNRNKIDVSGIYSTSDIKRTVTVIKTNSDEIPSIVIQTPNSQKSDKYIAKRTNVKFNLGENKIKNNNNDDFEDDDILKMLSNIAEDIIEKAEKIKEVVDKNK